MNSLQEILNKENALMDKILLKQKILHDAVKEKNWIGLENVMSDIDLASKEFSSLEDERTSSKETVTLEHEKVKNQVRQKLLKSKIENDALTEYISVTNNFVQGVLDAIVPQRKNATYGRNGKLIQKQPQSVVLNKVL